MAVYYQDCSSRGITDNVNNYVWTRRSSTPLGSALDPAAQCAQEETGGITEFVPLPFVAREAPIFIKGNARLGPTYREALLMHAIARLVLNSVIPNIQTSWVKMGPMGALDCLKSGANDFGGVLMDESITRAAGAKHGQQLSAARMSDLITSINRRPRQRSTLYSAPRTGKADGSGAQHPRETLGSDGSISAPAK